MKLRIMSYNIRIGIESSMACVAKTVERLGTPDVLALQEITAHWHMGERLDEPAYLAGALGLPHYVFAGALTDSQGGRFGVALVSRWPLETPRVWRLPRAEDEQRVLLRARLASPTPMWLFNTHLSIRENERLAQAKAINRHVAAVEGPVLLAGDLNDVPDSPTVHAIRGVTAGHRDMPRPALTNSFETHGVGPPETFSTKRPARTIDYIVHNATMSSVGPAYVARDGMASDHFPLVASLETIHRGPG